MASTPAPKTLDSNQRQPVTTGPSSTKPNQRDHDVVHRGLFSLTRAQELSDAFATQIVRRVIGSLPLTALASPGVV